MTYYSKSKLLKSFFAIIYVIILSTLAACSSNNDNNGNNNTIKKDWSFLAQYGITTVFRITNTTLYRQLLPADFDMPDMPLMVVAIVYYYDVTLPLTPYHEGYVLLAGKYQGRTGLHTLTMPVDNKTANDAGVYLGFPKYVADTIELVENIGGWSGKVVSHGRMVMQIEFTSDGSAPVETTSRNPNPPVFNHVTWNKATTVLEVYTNLFEDQQKKTVAGSSIVYVDTNEPWAKLLENAIPVLVNFEVIKGYWILNWKQL